MREDDRIRLRHMLDAAREAVHFAEGKSRDDLDGDFQISGTSRNGLMILVLPCTD